jgi:hypothetical protein
MKKTIPILLAFLSLPILAANEQVPINSTITLIQAYDDYVYVHFSPEQSFNQGCSNPSSKQVTIDTTNERGKNMYTAALLAAAANKVVGFGVRGCDNANREKIYRIDVKF